jgi:hypothetical protein
MLLEIFVMYIYKLGALAKPFSKKSVGNTFAAETRLESVGESLFKEPLENALAKMLPATLQSKAGGRRG